MFDKLAMQTKDLVQDNIQKIAELFPDCITESKEGDKTVRSIDFDALKQELSRDIVEVPKERYQLSWPGKYNSKHDSYIPITATLRPCVEDSVDFFNTKNVYIEGDNLDALKLLSETYLNKIDVIYIDPPYNTGNDILYKNNYSESADEFDAKYELDSSGCRMYVNSDTNGRYHSDWLSMMYSRILLSKNLLKDTGFFLVAIDHNELFNLGEICDEIFGYSNRIGVISVVHKPEGRNQAKFIGPSNEFMLIYAKNEQSAKLQKVVLDEEQSKTFNCTDQSGAYRLKNFIRLSDGKYATRESKPNFWYPIYVSEDLETLTLNETPGFRPVYPITESGVERTWKTTPDTFLTRYSNGDIIAKNENGTIHIYEKLREDQVIKTHWIEKKYHGFHFGTKILDDLLGVKTFDFPKSLYLMRDIYKLFCPKDGLILDYFSGSATSAHAIMKLNAEDGGDRHYIMVQIPAICDTESDAYKVGFKTICDIGKERIRRSSKAIKKECLSKLDCKTPDLGFRVFKIDTSNMNDIFYNPNCIKKEILDYAIDNIKPGRSGKDLLIQIMLEIGIELSAPISIEMISNKEVYSVDSNYLLACFDENITDEIMVEIAKKKPTHVVVRDSSLASDSVAINFEQIFKAYSPNTHIKVL